ncbi:MAG: hypothetical protein JWO31_2216, partial [Phycisphaerales bacterium]|nr:hypothetical protein [Phycisphaerales bacterium]
MSGTVLSTLIGSYGPPSAAGDSAVGQTATGPITRDELARVMDAQARAYAALVWLSTIAHARPHLLTERTADDLRDPVRCRAWLVRHEAQLPERVRPMADQEVEFARLFAGFFQSSFRVERRLWDGRPYYVIRTNPDEAAGRHKVATRKVPRALRRKRQAEADRLLDRALAAVGGDAAVPAVRRAAAADDALAVDLLAWGYAV